MTEPKDVAERASTYFKSGATLPLSWRYAQLRALRSMILENRAEIAAALWTDLHKYESEALVSEVYVVLDEISYALRRLKKWSRPSKLVAPLLFQPASAKLAPQPKGTILIISPWNYPFQLTLAPLVGAIAAGCTAVVKPSEHSPATSSLLADLIPRYLDSRAVEVVLGSVPETTNLLTAHFDHIFYTGGETVGRIVMQAASTYCTPVTLELGGKSPVWFDEIDQVASAARRIAWAKFTNAGQTCIAPDYVLVPRGYAEMLIDHLHHAVESMWGTDPQLSSDYGRIVNQGHFHRMAQLLEDAPVCWGGNTDEDDLYIAPTVVHYRSWEEAQKDPLMASEIFGPILPIIEVGDYKDAIDRINSRPKPLTLYVFSADRGVRKDFVEQTASGSTCINVGLLQAGTSRIPFGGIGASGIGAYHGKNSFDLFTHFKPVLSKPLHPDTLRIIQPPYTDLRKKIIDFLV